MKRFIKKLSPKFIFSIYYYLLAIIGAVIYGFPSKRMVVIGITGTKGKTSAINFIWSVLNNNGMKTGIITTANIRIGEKEFLNKYHMTMPGRFNIQKLMSEMVKEKCKYCLVETTSEGIKQFRHIGIDYDIAIFTNLTPEHLQSHGSFENYKIAKAKLFKHISSHKKIIDGKEIEKIIIVNNDDENKDLFLSFPANKKITFGIKSSADYKAENIIETNSGVDFSINNRLYKLSILGKFNVYNSLPAIIIGNLLNIKYEDIYTSLNKLSLIPGRMEIINEGQKFLTIVDYAHEKESITGLLNTANNMKKNGGKIIILLGAEGGGRDKAKRPIMGELSAKYADFVIVSNVDPYDDNPKEIIEDIAIIAEKFGKKRNENLFTIEDRKDGIRKAISLAKENDIVLITGKGAEQSMIINGQNIPWDDRLIVKEELKKILK